MPSLNTGRWPLARIGFAAVLLTLSACNSVYRLGGTVTGLTSDGLVIANGSDTVSVAANATVFYMPKELTEGTSYKLTVQTQPKGLVCAFSSANGASPSSGTMPANYIIDTALVCAPASHTLGGTVTGLTANGLVIANGSDTVAVAPNASTFTLPTPVDVGSSYNLTVRTQPTGFTCTFSSASNVAPSSGTMPAEDVTTALACAANPYTLGGTITGLTTGGLVIANGSDSVAVVAGATAFTLPTAVLVGSSYALTVQTQPLGLTCAFASGNNAASSSGTMPAADLTSTVLVCSPNPYILGGSITGLTAVGLVIANGSDTVTLPANATSFTLPTQVDAGSSYALTVQSQPTGLVCSFSSGSGIAPSSGTMPPGNLTTTHLVCSVATYALGGNVSGLSGTLLLKNGSDTVIVTANGHFQFPTEVPYHAGYSVQVQTQPVSQICTVSNGAGTMQGSAVTNVNVVCGTIHTISGTISGLTTNGLVLLNNGGDAMTLNAGATSFTMTTAVADGSTYAITVGTQPYGYFQCTVTNGSGTASADVTNVTISCAPHNSGPSTAITNLSGPVGAAVDSGGNLLVANFDSGTVVKLPYVNGTYGTGTVIASIPGAFGLALDSHDNLFVTNYSSAVYMVPYTNGTYGTPTSIGITNNTFSGTFGVVVDANGNLYVSNYFDHSISLIPYDNGNYSSSAIVYRDGSFASPAGIAIDGAGYLVAADFGSNAILTFPINPDLSLATPTSYSDPSFSSPTGVVLDAAGSLYVVNSLTNTVTHLQYSGGTVVLPGDLFGSGYHTPYGATVDHQGQLIVTNYSTANATVIGK